jgi:hypothetical protein
LRKEVKRKKMEKMRIKTIGACLIVFLAVMLVLMSTTPVAMAIPGQLRLSTVDGSYVDSSEDAWLHESYVTTATSFDLDITNHNGADIYHLYLLVAVDRDPDNNVTVEVDNNPVYPPYSGYGTILGNGKAEVPQAIVPPHGTPYEYPGHGIYNSNEVNTHFKVVELTIPSDGKLVAGETISVPVEITLLTSPTVPVRVHFDAVGADNNNYAIAFVPPSEDVTHQVPEFTTIAIPVASILGLLFLFNHRKHRKK